MPTPAKAVFWKPSLRAASPDDLGGHAAGDKSTGLHDREPLQQSYPIIIRGRVVHGDQRGRVIGFPTANVLLQREALPEFGVYAGWLDGRPAAISIGVRPAFGDGLRPMLEAHVIGFDGDLYGRDVTVTLVQRVRAELKFNSVEALVSQIRYDVDLISETLSAALAD